MPEQFANNFSTTLNGAITNSATSLIVNSATGAPSGPTFRILIDSEIMIVTAGGSSTTSWTVTRGAEGTSASSHANGATVTQILTLGALQQMLSDNYILHSVGGRLTLASGTPVPTSDQTAKTTIYWTPYRGARLALFDGTKWFMEPFSETSVAVPSTTTTPFDVFGYDVSGTFTLQTVNWTNDTTRATSLTTQDGVYVKNGDTTKRYLGTGRTTGTSGQCEDSALNRLLWNYYNRVNRLLYKDISASHSYNSSTIRAYNNDSSQRVSMVVGELEDLIEVGISEGSSSSSQVGFSIGIGENSTTAYCTHVKGPRHVNQNGPFQWYLSFVKKYPSGVGYNYYQACESSDGNVAFSGDFTSSIFGVFPG